MRTTAPEAEDLLAEVRSVKENHHDTLYCRSGVADGIASRVSTPSLNAGTIDNIRVAGLDVQTIPLPENMVIICQKGEVFNLAKDYKNAAQ